MLQPGTKLGPYEIVSPLGAGGMGEVYRARDTRLDRTVAVKILPAEFAQNEQLRLRFEREAKAISSLNHPNICTLYDVGDNYLVMELLDGESLADRIARGPLPIEQTLRIGAEIAAALDRAHRSGIVHRDLKPGNVMLTKSGAKLLDFGLATSGIAASQASQASGTIDGATMQRPLTQEGTIVGTFQYMSPEQVAGEPLDPRSDIFALGCVLYEMATGRRAFAGATRTSLIAAIVASEPRPLREVAPLTPPAFEHVVAKCLSKDPDERWQSAHDVAEELRWIAAPGSQAGVAAPVLSKRRNRERVVWFAIVTALAAAFAYVALRQPPTRQFRVDVTPPRQVVQSMISPDGKQIAFVTYAPGVRQLCVRRLDSTEIRVLLTAVVSDICWSPDSTSIAFLVGGRISRLSLAGGAPKFLAETKSDVQGLAWSSHTIIWGLVEGPIQGVAEEGGAVRALTRLDPSRHDLGHMAPAFLPDGKRFLFINYTRDPALVQRHDLRVGSLDGAPSRLIGDIDSQVWTTADTIYFVRDGTLFASPFDPKSLRIGSDARPITDDVFYFQPTGSAVFSVSRDGSIAWSSPDMSDHLALVDVNGRVVSDGNPGNYESIRVSGDGSAAYASLNNPKNYIGELRVIDLERRTSVRLSDPRWDCGAPQPAPDGRHLFYGSDQLGAPDIWVKTLDGSEADHVVLRGGGDQFPMDVSRDGEMLLYRTSERGNSDLYALPLKGGAPIAVATSEGDERHAKFSPDGRFVVYHSNESGTREVMVTRFRGGGVPRQVSNGGGLYPSWSNDGRTIYFAKGKSLYAAAVTDGVPAEPKLLFTLADRIAAVSVMPDGRFLVVLTNEASAIQPIHLLLNAK
jgi:Tol biopolymer transport system component/predicted Ser/Thr protein kinase